MLSACRWQWQWQCRPPSGMMAAAMAMRPCMQPLMRRRLSASGSLTIEFGVRDCKDGLLGACDVTPAQVTLVAVEQPLDTYTYVLKKMASGHEHQQPWRGHTWMHDTWRLQGLEPVLLLFSKERLRLLPSASEPVACMDACACLLAWLALPHRTAPHRRGSPQRPSSPASSWCASPAPRWCRQAACSQVGRAHRAAGRSLISSEPRASLTLITHHASSSGASAPRAAWPACNVRQAPRSGVGDAHAGGCFA